MYVKFSAVHEWCGSVVLNHDVAIMSLSALIDSSKISLFLSLGSITFNPTAWNIVARNGEPSSNVRPPFASMIADHHFLPLSTYLCAKRIPQQDNHSHFWRQCLSRLLLPHSVHFRCGLIA